jgi:hypothetical protein
MTRRRRLLAWCLVLPANAILLVLLGTPLALAFLCLLPGPDGGFGDFGDGVGEALGEGEYWAWALPVSGAITATQAIFLVPVVKLRPPRGERGRSLTASIVVAGALGAIVVTALGLGLMELGGAIAAGSLVEDPWHHNELSGQVWAGPACLVLLAGSWVGWTILLMAFSRARWADTLLGRVAAGLLAGTVVELLVVLPIDQMVRRRTDCYCAAGTFWSILGSVVALLWLTGPGIAFALTSRRRRLLRETHCARCGYAKGPLPAAAAGSPEARVCPECGYDWGVTGTGGAAR